jgi:hypothetical protein
VHRTRVLARQQRGHHHLVAGQCGRPNRARRDNTRDADAGAKPRDVRATDSVDPSGPRSRRARSSLVRSGRAG